GALYYYNCSGLAREADDGHLMAQGGQEDLRQLAGEELEAGGVDAGVAAEELLPEHVLVHEQADAPLPVVHEAEDGDRAGADAEQLLHLLRGAEGEPRGIYLCGE